MSKVLFSKEKIMSLISDLNLSLDVVNINKFDKDLGKKRVGSDFVRCKSGFNGLAIYTMKSVNDSSYKNSDFYCEHIDLHYDMNKKGYDKVYYNPNMIMFTGQPGPDRVELLKNPFVVT